MLPKPHIDFNVFYLISLESRDLLDFYCTASIVYDICFLTFIFTPSFSSPILEGNAVGVRIQFPPE